MEFYIQNLITNLNLMNNLKPCFNYGENCIPAIKMRGWRMCDEPLRSFCVLTGGGHTYAPCCIFSFHELRTDRVVFATRTIATFTTSLHYKIGYHTMKELFIEVVLVSEAN